MRRGVSATRLIMQFVIGILLVWLYAAMRPRFGPGMKTAAYAALVIWLCGFIFYMDWLFLGMMKPGTYVVASCVALVSLMVGAWIGGMVFKENGRAGGMGGVGGRISPPRGEVAGPGASTPL